MINRLMPVLSRASPKLLRDHRDLRASFSSSCRTPPSTCNDASRGRRERGSRERIPIGGRWSLFRAIPLIPDCSLRQESRIFRCDR